MALIYHYKIVIVPWCPFSKSTRASLSASQEVLCTDNARHTFVSRICVLGVCFPSESSMHHSFTVERFEHPHYCCSCALHPQVFDIVYLSAKRPLCFFPFVAVSSGYSAFSFRKQNKEHTKHKTKQKKNQSWDLRQQLKQLKAMSSS